MVRRGRVNTLIVAKLDRLSRSLRDVCALVEELFSDERYHLLSLCGMVNTPSAAGRMVLMNLANYCQFARKMISERTRDVLQQMKAQGVGEGTGAQIHKPSERRFRQASFNAYRLQSHAHANRRRCRAFAHHFADAIRQPSG
jgi:DNA invertase Pin-like site-specific DNA recombinase